MKGVVKMFNAARGFGFVKGEDGIDAYIHATEILGGATLAQGDNVEYEVVQGERGPAAKKVKKI
jgi:CspA family cold shock protein